MTSLTTITAGEQIFREMEEFGKLPMAAQRYIRRSLQIRSGSIENLAEISRTPSEAKSMCRQMELYSLIDDVVAAIPADDEIGSVTRFMSLLAPLVAFDVGEQKLESFAAFSFLYERMLGAAARPWLPTAFMMVASLPELHPNRRIDLLGSVCADVVTSHWSTREPQFVPEWIEDIAC